MNEQWKDVEGYEGIYQMSSLGRVRSFHQDVTVGRILEPYKAGRGYLQVTLCRDEERKRVYVHRLVAFAFLGPAPSPDHEINHKNGNKQDNRVENLEWVTAAYNTRHAIRALGVEHAVGEKAGAAKITEQDVKEIRKLYKTGEHTQAELGEMFGITQSAIHLIICRKNWKHVP